MPIARYIFIVGGVMSGIGKGIVTASIGKILQNKEYKVSVIKIDPYINIDAGTMNPIEHGEVFVTDDGLECDQDIGNYERFLNQDLSADNYMTTGRIYQTIINKERRLEYKGKCVEVIPHVPNEIIRRIRHLTKVSQADFLLIEIGGTAGEYQNALFLEAARMLKLKKPKHVLFVLVSYLPIHHIIGEMKTKPTQHAVQLLNTAGIQPDFLLGRSSKPLDEIRKNKIATFCNISKKNIISVPDVNFIFDVPLILKKQYLDKKILKKFELESNIPLTTNYSTKSDLEKWQDLSQTIKTAHQSVKIGIVGKYFESGRFILKDAYISVIEAIKHASWFYKIEPEITWLSAESYQEKVEKTQELKNYDGIIVPGGFGIRGIEGKIKVINFCRCHKIPWLGLCLGMQLAVVEFARNVCQLKEAHSTEFSPTTPFPVIDIMSKQKKILKDHQYGGTMRLGSYHCQIKPNTIAAKSYNDSPPGEKTKTVKIITERHRHRYELNNKFRKTLENDGMIMSGVNPEKNLVEIIEISNHPFFVGVQFHPEFKSRPFSPHPLFKEFIKQSLK